MPSFIDFTNKKIGRVFVEKFLGKDKNGESTWRCLCDCDQEFKSHTRNFKKGDLFECKKCRISRRTVDLTGKIFSRWTVLGRAPPDHRGKTQWNCKCECGIERIVADNSLKKPRRSMSCGCLGRKLKSKWVNPSLYPKQSLLSTNEKNFYQMRAQLIHKCYNPKYSTYSKFGEKGITVCDLWRNDAKAMFEWAKILSWNDSDSIVLENGKTEFNPENCTIITESEMRSRIGKKGGIYITIGRKKKKIKEWCAEKGISKSCLTRRVKKGLSYEDAIKCPIKTHKLKNLDYETKKSIIEDYMNCISLREIGRKFNVSGISIRYLLKKQNIKMRPIYDRSGYSNEQVQEELKNGLNPCQIARKFNVTSTCIYTRIKTMNGIKRKR